MNRGRAVVLGSMGAVALLATVRSVAARPGLPPPGIYVGTGAIFSLWYFLAGPAPALAGTLAVGTLVASLLAPYVAGKTTGPIDQLAALVTQISGGNPAAPPGASSTPATSSQQPQPAVGQQHYS